MAENVEQLKLDRSQLNPFFNSWKLVDGLVKESWTLDLAAPATYQKNYGTSYLHTRTAVLHNNLQKMASGNLLFFQADKLCKLERQQRAWAVVEIGPSLAAQGSLLPPECQLAASVVEIAHSSSNQTGGEQLLLSSGNGDIAYCLHGTVSEPIFPLQQRSKPQAFILAGAAAIAGEIQVVMWSIEDKARPSHVQVHLATLAVDTASAGQPRLRVIKVQPLRKAAVGPHFAQMHPDAQVLVLAVDPGDGEEDTQAAALSQAKGKRISLTRQLMELAADEGYKDESDAVSPRTMAAAVHRLQQFTQDASAEEGAGPGMWSDVYSEADRADELSASGAEADCELLVYSLEGSSPAMAFQLSCRPYKVLASEPSCGLLGLSVDVDCAIIQVGCSGRGADAAAQAQHIATLPAFAYVAEGKVQRKFVLLGMPGDPIAAAIIESHKYVYIYRPIASEQAHGQHQLVDMALPEGSGVLGAQLVKSSDMTMHLLILTSSQVLGFEFT